jgi:hypothetical protein
LLIRNKRVSSNRDQTIQEFAVEEGAVSRVKELKIQHDSVPIATFKWDMDHELFKKYL